jgi:hypothetical protein
MVIISAVLNLSVATTPCPLTKREYLVWRVTEQAVSWFSLQSGTDATLLPNEQGILKSLVFPGLWLNVPALIEAQVTGVLATLPMGILF